MVSNPAANPGPLYRHGPPSGAFPQPNRGIKVVAEGVDLGCPRTATRRTAAVSARGYNLAHRCKIRNSFGTAEAI